MTELTADRVHVRRLFHLEPNRRDWSVTLEPNLAAISIVSMHRTWAGARWAAAKLRRQLRRRAIAMMDHPTAGFPR